jgi:O-antigen/teichoic acid export membrane protein
MSESDESWNQRERDETELQRLDRNFIELLQELRVAQTGPQILFAFLLTLTFTQRFGATTTFQRGLYFVTLVLSAAAASLLIAPVSVHRLLFRRHEKRRLVAVSNRLAIGGLLSLCLAIVGVLWFIADVLYGQWAGAATAVLSAAWFGFFWYAIPVRLSRPEPKQEQSEQGGHDDSSAGSA